MILATGDATRFAAEIAVTFVAYGIYTFFVNGYRMQFRRAVKRVEAQVDAGSSTTF
jgi:ATP-binding cassette subfamily B protein